MLWKIIIAFFLIASVLTLLGCWTAREVAAERLRLQTRHSYLTTVEQTEISRVRVFDLTSISLGLFVLVVTLTVTLVLM